MLACTTPLTFSRHFCTPVCIRRRVLRAMYVWTPKWPWTLSGVVEQHQQLVVARDPTLPERPMLTKMTPLCRQCSRCRIKRILHDPTSASRVLHMMGTHAMLRLGNMSPQSPTGSFHAVQFCERHHRFDPTCASLELLRRPPCHIV